jgi:signal transduction histidine kinase
MIYEWLGRIYQRLEKPILNWITPRSSDCEAAFRERNLRLMVLLGMALFIVMLAMNILRGMAHSEILWHLFIFGALGLVAWAVHTGRLLWAGRLVALAAFSILLDTSAAYWSPGTVLFGVLYSFVFLLVLPNLKEMLFPMGVNLAIYVALAVSATTPAPLSPLDFYAAPGTAILATLMGHVLILTMGVYIRREQAERSRKQFVAEQGRANDFRQLLNNVSHDLITPLSTIKTSLYLLGKTATETQQPRLDRLEEQTNHLEHTLTDMLEIARLDGGAALELTPLDMHTVVGEVMHASQRQADIRDLRLQAALEADKSIVVADATYMRRMLMAISENALNYTPDGGTVIIRTVRRQQQLVIEVEDTGIGIDSVHLPRIFDHFYRVDPARDISTGRSGLGLAFAKKIVELHGGSIEVSSEAGAGSVFRVVLPLAG